MNRTRSFVAGAGLLALASLIDIIGVFATDGEHPPMWVAILGGVLGVVSLVLLGLAWRGSQAALGTAIALRAVSAASALPAFLVDGVPPAVVTLVVTILALNVVGTVLVWPALRRAPTAA